jgi:hypothetical protein
MAFPRNEAVVGFTFAPIDASDGSAITSGTVSVYLTLDGGTQAAATNTPTHEGNGQWSIDFTADEFDADIVGILFVHADAIPIQVTIATTAEDEVADDDGDATGIATTDLATIKTNLLARIISVTASPNPSYSIDGQSVSKNEYLRTLMDQLKAVNELILMEDPYVVVSNVI